MNQVHLRWIAIAALLAAAAHSFAQKPAETSAVGQDFVPSMTFDVVSVRESSPADRYIVGGENSPHSSVVRLTNMDLQNLLGIAYGVDWSQIKGLPDWAQRTMFHVQAKSDNAADERLAKLSKSQAWMEKEHMFRVLLAERFHLVTHWETKDGLVYELLISKSGSKLHPAGSVAFTPEELKSFGERKIPSLYQRGDGRRGYEFIGHGCSMNTFAETLTGQMGAPVVDKTGMTGDYDFLLQYKGTTEQTSSDDPTIWSPLITAVPDQLGLKLNSAKGPRLYLVVDHVEKPTEN